MTPPMHNQLNMNIFMVMFFVFLAGCCLDLCKYLFFAFAWLFFGWPDECVFKVLDANLAFSVCFMVVFSATPVLFPVVDDLLLDFFELVVGQLYNSLFYRQFL
nr:nonstructural protein 8 [Alphacoronavirus sp.]